MLFRSALSAALRLPDGSSLPLQCDAAGVTLDPGGAATVVVVAAAHVPQPQLWWPLGTGGAISLFNNLGRVHLVADVVGWYG